MRTKDDALLVPSQEIERMQADFAEAYDPLSIQLLFSIRSLARRINDAASLWLEPFGLTATKYNYLAVLYANRDTGMSPTQIGAVVHTVSASVASMINALEHERLITRSIQRADRRRALVRLTKRGERIFFNAATAHHAHVTAIARSLPTREAEHLLQLVLRLGAAVREQPPISRIRGNSLGGPERRPNV